MITQDQLQDFKVESKFRKDGLITLRALRHVKKYYRGEVFTTAVDGELAKFCLFPFPKWGPAAEEIRIEDFEAERAIQQEEQGNQSATRVGRGEGVPFARGKDKDKK